jgi:hypothetical protein
VVVEHGSEIIVEPTYGSGQAAYRSVLPEDPVNDLGKLVAVPENGRVELRKRTAPVSVMNPACSSSRHHDRFSPEMQDRSRT